MTNVSHHIETSHLTCQTNQLTGFYVMENIRSWVNQFKINSDFSQNRFGLHGAGSSNCETSSP